MQCAHANKPQGEWAEGPVWWLESQGWQDDRKSKARGKFQKQGQQIGNQVTNRTQKSQQGMATTESNVPDKQAQTTDWSHQGTTTAKGQAPTEAFILSNGHHVSKLQVNVSTPGRSIFPSAQRKVHTACYRQKCATTQLFLTHSVPSRPHRLVADMATQPRESSPASEILRGQGPKGKTRPLRQ